MESIDNIIAFEVKKEIADRYFGFRRIIETDTALYHSKITQASALFKESVGHDLICIYTLLSQDSLIDNFLSLIGLEKENFHQSRLKTTPKNFSQMAKQKCRGLTRKACLRNMFLDLYIALYQHIQDYRSIYDSLEEDHETIEAQISIFYRKNDIQSIVQLLRTLGSGYQDLSPIQFNTDDSTSLEAKLRLSPPPPVVDLLPTIPAIPPVKPIRSKLKYIIEVASNRQPEFDLR